MEKLHRRCCVFLSNYDVVRFIDLSGVSFHVCLVAEDSARGIFRPNGTVLIQQPDQKETCGRSAICRLLHDEIALAYFISNMD